MTPISPFPVTPYRPMAKIPAPATDPALLVSQLGTLTVMTLDGNATYNQPLVNALVAQRERALPALGLLFKSSNNTPTLIEGLYTACQMADAGVRNMEMLYPSVLRLNNHVDPTIQMHLARFYRKINEPKAFGPMLSTAVNYAVNQYQMTSSPHYNVTEEVGATLLDQIASRTARETVRQLLPYLRPPAAPPLVNPQAFRR